MKRIIVLIVSLCLLVALTGCSKKETIGGADSKALVAYFSCTANTQRIAEYVAGALGAELYEIVPQVAYNSEDIDANADSNRARQEQNGEVPWPAIAGSVESMEDYDIIFLGYPIWWGEAPKILCTFLNSYDFSGKTVIPFCTSHSSGIGASATNLHEEAADSARWQEGMRFASGAAQRTVTDWINDLPLKIGKK